MRAQKQTPETLAASGVREIDLAGERVYREHIDAIADRQARKIVRRCLVSYTAAAVIAGLAYGGVSR